MANTTIQIAYKDSNGNLKYEDITTTTSYSDRKYNTAATTDVEYSIPAVDENMMYSFEKLAMGKWNKSKSKPVKKTLKGDGSTANQNSFPKYVSKNAATGRKYYDYTITIQKDIMQSIQAAKRNLNIPSAYSRLELNKLFHTKFNRFRIQYPDYFMNNTIGYVVFTRPDLNIFDGDAIHFQVANDPQLFYVMNASRETARSLTKGYSGSHHFNPLLSNTVMSLDVSDESIDTLETGETFTGYKTQYAKSNIRSMTAGSISVTFPETFNMAITHLHQLWCAYESGVYRGSLKPKEEYIWNKELDYACDIYYFILDAEDMVIRYWCKYTGCFPLNVNKSVFSFSGETQINHPSLSMSYAYFAREDMNPINLNEFNRNSGGETTNFKYKAMYIPDLGGCGNTWSGTPYVAAIKRGTGFSRDADLYALRFKN